MLYRFYVETDLIDAPGVLRHIIIQGIERRNVFRDIKDPNNLLDRLSDLRPGTKTLFYVWVLLFNHSHFLLRTRVIPLSNLMPRLLTGYDLMELARLLHMTQPGVGYVVRKGENLAKRNGYKLK